MHTMWGLSRNTSHGALGNAHNVGPEQKHITWSPSDKAHIM